MPMALNEDVRQQRIPREREPENTPRPQRVGRQVAAEIGGVAGPRPPRRAERNRHLEHERPGEGPAPLTLAGVTISCPPNQFQITANNHERREQHHGQDRLPVGGSPRSRRSRPAPCTPSTINTATPERDTQEHGQRFPRRTSPTKPFPTRSTTATAARRAAPPPPPKRHPASSAAEPVPVRGAPHVDRYPTTSRSRAPCRSPSPAVPSPETQGRARSPACPVNTPGHVHLRGRTQNRETADGASRTAESSAMGAEWAVRLDRQIPGRVPGPVTGEGSIRSERFIGPFDHECWQDWRVTMTQTPDGRPRARAGSAIALPGEPGTAQTRSTDVGGC